MPEASWQDTSTSLTGLRPFPGLRSFEPDEDHLYFGRERQIDELLRRLRHSRFLTIVGTSGSGKSSLVRAGLVPSLYSGLMTQAGSSWRAALMRPGANPIGNLAQALDDPLVLGRGEELGDAGRMMLEATLRSSSRGLVDSVRRAAIDPSDNVLVVVDQFEELFRFRDATTASRDQAAAFVKLLLAAAEGDVRLYIVLTMRSDFIGDCMEFAGLPEAINESQYLVPRMTRDELRLAITGPVGVSGARISPRLVSQLLNDIVDDQDQLPVLQHALMRVWGYWEYHRDTEDEQIDLTHYNAIGTMGQALSLHAEKIFQQLGTEREQEIAEGLFKALTDTDRDGRGIRRPVQVREISTIAAATDEEVISVIEAFRFAGRSFLMPPPPQPGVPGVTLDGDSTVDLSHESLMRKWERLIHWADEEAQAAKLYRRLSEAAELHEAGQAGLWRTPELDIGLRWQRRRRPTAAWAERYSPAFERAMNFLAESQRERKRYEERLERERINKQKKARWRRLIAVGVALLVFVFFWGSARLDEQEARLQAILMEQDPLRKVLLLDELDDKPGLLGTFFSPSREMDLPTLQQIAASTVPLAVLRDPGALEGLVGAAFAPANGEVPESVVTVSADGALRWWRSDGHGDPEGFAIGERMTAEAGERDNSSQATGASFSADRQWLAVHFEDGTGWYGPTKGPGDFLFLQVNGGGARIKALAFSPDSSLIASGYDDNTVRVWDRLGGGSVLLGEGGGGHLGEISGVAFDTQGDRLVTASWDGTARIWDLEDPSQAFSVLKKDVRRASPPTAQVSTGSSDKDSFSGLRSAAFSPDGQWVVCAYSSGVARIWRADGTGIPSTLEGHRGSVTSGTFSPDGSRIATASEDGTARVWDLQLDLASDDRLIHQGSRVIPTNHKGLLKSVAFSTDGKKLVTTSEDGTARLWSTEPREPRILGRHSQRVESVVFDLQGDRVLTASDDKTAVIWSRDESIEPEVFADHIDWVRSAAFDPYGTKVITASEDGTSRLHFLDSGKVRVFPSGGRVFSAAFDPAGARIVTAGAENLARIWRLDDDLYEHTLELRGHEDWVWGAGFSPDGSQIVTASADGTARIWDSGSGESLITLAGHNDRVLSATFSDDGSRIATTSADRTARIWDPVTGSSLLTLRHGASVNDAAFSPDGAMLVTASEDGTARLWSTTDGTEQLVLRQESENWAVAFSPDGSQVATGSKDGSVRLWRITRAALDEFVRSASTACLTPDWRVRFLAESERQARRRYEECEREHGRHAAVR